MISLFQDYGWEKLKKVEDKMVDIINIKNYLEEDIRLRIHCYEGNPIIIKFQDFKTNPRYSITRMPLIEKKKSIQMLVDNLGNCEDI